MSSLAPMKLTPYEYNVLVRYQTKGRFYIPIGPKLNKARVALRAGGYLKFKRNPYGGAIGYELTEQGKEALTFREEQ